MGTLWHNLWKLTTNGSLWVRGAFEGTQKIWGAFGVKTPKVSAEPQYRFKLKCYRQQLVDNYGLRIWISVGDFCALLAMTHCKAAEQRLGGTHFDDGDVIFSSSVL